MQDSCHMWRFRRKDPPRPAPDIPPAEWNRLQRQVGKLEAEVESLELKWTSYRDELRRLVQRLEKREQRAVEREAVTEATEHPRNPLAERLLQRRNVG